MVTARFEESLRIFTRHQTEFIVAGGVAAILHGSPLTTMDIDLVYRVGDQNCQRLTRALQELDASYADPAGRIIRPDAERLGGTRVHLLNTNCGRVDLMQTIGADRDYAWLLPRSQELKIEELSVPVLELDTIIETKEYADRPKDRYQLPFLRQLRAEIQRLGEETE